MQPRKFYTHFLDVADKPIEGGITVTAYTIDQALQVVNAWIIGRGYDYRVQEIRAEAKRGHEYGVSL